uniref:Uncharacterized protein n=1 Tax=Helianthus annuus TaxID=4232 RepID=A0A251T5W1_HELAN
MVFHRGKHDIYKTTSNSQSLFFLISATIAALTDLCKVYVPFSSSVTINVTTTVFRLFPTSAVTRSRSKPSPSTPEDSTPEDPPTTDSPDTGSFEDRL